jgi:L-threonylcarbamoyladenylate synthase
MLMASRLYAVDPSHPDPAVIAEAGALVRSGGLVAFPTETVYGLAANADLPAAIDRLHRVKGRPPEKPYSIHLADPEQLARFVERVPPAAQRLIARFWPGPLTLVLPARGGWLGFRLPDHPVARAFLRACGCTVVAPSANPSGAPAPTDAREVAATLDGAIDAILDAGPTPVGRESSVVRVDRGVEILREGAISADAIRAAANAG